MIVDEIGLTTANIKRHMTSVPIKVLYLSTESGRPYWGYNS